MVHRYTIIENDDGTGYQGRVYHSVDGDYVKHDDYDRLKTALDEIYMYIKRNDDYSDLETISSAAWVANCGGTVSRSYFGD